MLFALTIFAAACLLFLVQPIVAKHILPWFGGTAALWSTCLVFFQAMLLAGYYYADLLTRKLSARRQLLLHGGLIVLALVLLPIAPSDDWKPNSKWVAQENPSLRILLLLTATVGLPYFVLSSTGPLMQVWFARAHPQASPYRLFALSNFGSMLALLGYPLWVEPTLPLRQQAILWSIGFALTALAIMLAMRRGLRAPPVVVADDTAAAPAPTIVDKSIWLGLSAFGSCLLLGVSAHLTQNIAAVPLLWVAPLAIYLLTFILCFGLSERWMNIYRRFVSLPVTAASLCAMAWLLADRRWEFDFKLHATVFGAGLFFACMYCHGELAARKPAPSRLTGYYLTVAGGGAIGALLIGIGAPLLLAAHFELGLTLYLLALSAAWLLWRERSRGVAVAGAMVCIFALSASMYSMYEFRRDASVMTRNFYGALRVRESLPDEIDGKRWLIHGGIMHGDQYLDDARRRLPTAYYRDTSGIGLAINQKQQDLDRPIRIGVIGLGAGTLAAYGRAGDVIRFYEINPAVAKVARENFSFLSDSAATVEIALGDARLTLEGEAPQRFDILAVDAFNSDAIPMHLLTLEALAAYERHLADEGIVAFHISNRFLYLHPVLDRIAAARNLSVAWIEEVRDDGSTVSDWILLSPSANMLERPYIAAAAQPIPARPHWTLWTDDFNNILQVLRD